VHDHENVRAAAVHPENSILLPVWPLAYLSAVSRLLKEVNERGLLWQVHAEAGGILQHLAITCIPCAFANFLEIKVFNL
jgi:hypothetical protein